MSTQPLDDHAIEQLLSTPTPGAIAAAKQLDGDYMVLGVGGKMGTSTAVMLRRALEAAGKKAKVYGVSRFSRPEAKRELEACGVLPISCDLADPDQVAKLPEVVNVEYLAGQKFGTDSAPDETWIQNTVVPSIVAKKFRASRIVVFSTGCVYPFTPVDGRGATEATPVAFLGEYASTCVGRERVFTHYARKYGTKQLMYRLNYSVELRYGVLVDIGQRVLAGEPVDITMNVFNFIWQGDACARAIQCLQHVANPPKLLNVTGPEKVTLRDAAERFGKIFGQKPIITGTPAPTAWHSDASESIRLFGPTTKSLDDLIGLIADHLRIGGKLLGKPTHFETRDGKFLTMDLRAHLHTGHVIPAQPLALDAARMFSERHQRAITRYYVAAGCGGLAVGVHSTQFEIREPQHGLFQPVLELASRTIDEELKKKPRPFIKISGVCGRTEQAVREAELANLGYHAGLLSLAAFKNDAEEAMIAHCRRVAEVFPIVGFYLQPAAGGRLLGYSFWRKFAEIPNVIAIKLAPFNRYQTIDVMRALAESGRDDIALYTGNDDSIVVDLFTPFTFEQNGKKVTRRIVGGLLGHWGVWTRSAVQLLEEIKHARGAATLETRWLEKAIAVTDMNAALFDSANGFRGCIPGILEVLRRGGLVPTLNCLNPHEVLSPGQAEELTRVARAYPELTDDAFVAANRDKWLS